MRRHLLFLSLLTVLLLIFSSCASHADTALTMAAEAGDVQTVESLIAHGANVNERDAHGYTALMWASRGGHTEVIKSLLDAKADPNLRDCSNTGWPALVHAIHKSQNNAALLLIERGADVNEREGRCGEQNPQGGMTPLIFAAGYDNTEIVKALLERGADPRAESGSNTVLANAVGGAWDIDRPAAERCPTETVKAILEKAPDLKLGNDLVARSSLFFAKRHGCTEVVQMIEQHRAEQVGTVTEEGHYKINITPSGLLSNRTGFEEHDGIAIFHSCNVFGSETEVAIRHGELSVNDQNYGKLKEGDSINVDHGKVFINSKEAHAVEVVASR